MARAQQEREGPVTDSALISLHHVALGYGPRILVADACWAIHRGECWALVGANGAGKTTLLQVLAGLKKPRGGSVNVACEVSMGLISQRAQLSARVPLTTYDFVRGGDVRRGFLRPAFGARAEGRHHRVMTLLTEVDLEAQAQVSFEALSEGMRQRAWVARALMARPNVLILDEPTSAMDPRQEARALHLLATLAKRHQAALIVVGHHLDALVSVCTHIAWIDADNNQLKTGKKAQLKAPVYRALSAREGSETDAFFEVREPS